VLLCSARCSEAGSSERQSSVCSAGRRSPRRDSSFPAALARTLHVLRLFQRLHESIAEPLVPPFRLLRKERLGGEPAHCFARSSRTAPACGNVRRCGHTAAFADRARRGPTKRAEQGEVAQERLAGRARWSARARRPQRSAERSAGKCSTSRARCVHRRLAEQDCTHARWQSEPRARRPRRQELHRSSAPLCGMRAAAPSRKRAARSRAGARCLGARASRCCGRGSRPRSAIQPRSRRRARGGTRGGRRGHALVHQCSSSS